MKKIFESERKFKLWAYSVSHSTLLIRSSILDYKDKNIDLVFSGVRHINCDTTFDTIKIYEKEKIDLNCNQYKIISGNIKFDIFSSLFHVYQNDNQNFFDISTLVTNN